MTPTSIVVDELPDGPHPAPAAQWDAYVSAHAGSSVYHLSALRQFVREATGHRVTYLRARRGTVLVGGLPMVNLRSRIFGNYFVGMPYFNYAGVLADDDEALAALLRGAAERAQAAGGSHIELRQLGPCEGIGWPAKQSKVEMFLDLPASWDALWKRFPPKLRAQIRRPSKAGVYARLGGSELLDDFYGVFARNMRDLGTPVYGRGFFGRFMSLLADRTRVAVCYLSGRPIAGGIVIGHRDILEIPWASTIRDHNALSPNMLLYATVLRYAVEQGYARFDFGRSTVDEGTYRFKRQWGARPIPLHWYYWLRDGDALPELNPHNPKYALAIRAWQRLPVPVTRIIGPHLVRNLP